MEIGRLNQRISILENHTKVDEIGNHIAKWEEVFSCWALVNIANSAEEVKSGVTKEVQSVKFTIRQNAFIFNSTTHKILFDGQVYDIKSVKRDYERREYMTITATARKAGEPLDIY